MVASIKVDRQVSFCEFAGIDQDNERSAVNSVHVNREPVRQGVTVARNIIHPLKCPREKTDVIYAGGRYPRPVTYLIGAELLRIVRIQAEDSHRILIVIFKIIPYGPGIERIGIVLGVLVAVE